MATVGEDALHKMCNMVRWIAQHTPPDRASDARRTVNNLSLLTTMSAMLFAQRVAEYRDAVRDRDFDELLADKENLPTEIAWAVNDVVRPNPELHDKFWRYLKFFCSLVSE